MSERCIVRVKFTPAGGDATVRRAVGGFLRYVQHRDLHPTSDADRPRSEVSGLVKYAAYRDGASARAELFAARGGSGTKARKDFVDFVGRSLAESQPQIYRSRDGRLTDRRRAVSRLIISPECSQGLDLERLTRAAVERLASDVGGDVPWIGAIHRNTAHHHVHLVIAGMRRGDTGGYHRVDITKARLAAIKESVALEIERQRNQRLVSDDARPRTMGGTSSMPALRPPPAHAPIRIPPMTSFPRRDANPRDGSGLWLRGQFSALKLRAAARRYQRQMEREAEAEAQRRQWELVA